MPRGRSDAADAVAARYAPGDYNCLHQDLYGENVFPIQVAILLSRPGEDFTGGELVLTEQRPRMQSRSRWRRSRRETVSRSRSTPGRSGEPRQLPCPHAPRRSRIREGERFTLGVIFHDAE
jgi:hypothetical protein